MLGSRASVLRIDPSGVHRKCPRKQHAHVKDVKALVLVVVSTNFTNYILYIIIGLCIKHGGGKKCQTEGCNKGAQRGGFCRAHGGGSKCTFPGCTKVDAGGGKCRAHGGGRRCTHPGCPKADVGGGFW